MQHDARRDHDSASEPRQQARPIDAHGCRARLRDGTVGRIAWAGSSGVQLYPVSYGVLDDVIVFRTSPDAALAELADPTEVVLEVDDLDRDRQRGWSVLVRGRTGAADQGARIAQPWTVEGGVPWADGPHDLVIAVTPSSFTGREFDRATGRD